MGELYGISRVAWWVAHHALYPVQTGPVSDPTTFVGSSVGLFVLGGLVGFIIGVLIGLRYGGALVGMHGQTLSNVLALVVATMWVISVVGELVVFQYQTPWYIHAIMGAIVGSVYGVQSEMFGIAGMRGGGGGGGQGGNSGGESDD